MISARMQQNARKPDIRHQIHRVLPIHATIAHGSNPRNRRWSCRHVHEALGRLKATLCRHRSLGFDKLGYHALCTSGPLGPAGESAAPIHDGARHTNDTSVRDMPDQFSWARQVVWETISRVSCVVARDRCCFSPYDATCDISSDRPPKVRNLFDDGFQVSLGSGYGTVIPISAARGRPLNSWFAGKSSQDELFSKRLDYPSGRTRPWPAERFSGRL